MIIEFEPDATKADVGKVAALATAQGGDCREITGRTGRVLVFVGTTDADALAIEELPRVSRVVRTTCAYPLADRTLRPAGTTVRVGGVCIGDGGYVVAARPRPAQAREELTRFADRAAGLGASLVYSGGATSAALMAADELRCAGLGVITEVTDPAQVEMAAVQADMLMVGTGNMQNFALLQELGRTDRPVMLERGMAATVEEWLLAAEYVLTSGNPQVVLCEGGIRTFESATRFTLDLSAVAVVKRRSHLPVFVDPGHATGAADLVPSMTLAASAAGADGVLLDVQSDGADAGPALQHSELQLLLASLERQLESGGRRLCRPQLATTSIAAG